MTSTTVKLPGAWYRCEGCCSFEPAPSPKSQLQLVAAVGPDSSVKVTSRGRLPVTGVAENAPWKSGGSTVIRSVLSSLSDRNPAVVTLSLTEYTPGTV